MTYDIGFFVLSDFRKQYYRTQDDRAKRILRATELMDDETLIRVWSRRGGSVWEWEPVC